MSVWDCNVITVAVAFLFSFFFETLIKIRLRAAERRLKLHHVTKASPIGHKPGSKNSLFWDEGL